MNIPEHKAIIKRLIEEAETEHGIQPVLPYTVELLAALTVLDQIEREVGRTR